MGALKPNEVTHLLFKWSQGNNEALDQLMPIVYQELHQIALSYLRRERPDHTLQPTALINEAYMRLIDQSLPQWQSRTHFFGVAARLMRQILVEHARRHHAAKRGGQDQKISLEETVQFSKERSAEMVSLDDALTALAAFDERKARVIELRYFGGLSIEETAEVIGVSMPTIGREQRLAEAWLERELQNK
jgi:RNA polymerase sigma factor (TIGR02999 family)